MNASLRSGATSVTPDPSATGAIPRAAVARAFGQAAASYDRHAQLQREVADTLLAGCAVSEPRSILDLGCGTGYCTARLRARYSGALLCALDIAEPMLQAVRVRDLASVPLVCGDAVCLPFAAQSFALLVSSLTIQWCADEKALFAELRRVLQPGGQVLLSTFAPTTLQELRRAWAAADAAVHVNGFVDPDRLCQAATEAGLSVTLRIEPRVRHYVSLRELAQELKGIGAHNQNAGRRTGLTSRSAFRRAEDAFASASVPGRGTPVSWDVCYLDLRRE